MGNWLEVAECIETLHGRGPADLEELVNVQSAQMLLQAGVVSSRAEGLAACAKALRDGSALAKFREMVAAQGGDVDMVDRHTEPCWHKAATVIQVPAPVSGVVSAIDALAIGKTGVLLGAGRKRVEDGVDFAAGVLIGTCTVTPVLPYRSELHYGVHCGRPTLTNWLCPDVAKKVGETVVEGEPLCTLYTSLSESEVGAAAVKMAAEGYSIVSPGTTITATPLIKCPLSTLCPCILLGALVVQAV